MKRGKVTNRVADRYLGIPVLAGMALFHRRRNLMVPAKRIGVMASPALGDTLLSSALLIDIRKHYPTSEIICFLPTTSSAAASLLPEIDKIVYVDLGAPVRTVREMRRWGLDLILDVTPWPRLTAFYSAASGAKVKVGFRSPNQHRHWNYDIVAEHSADRHEVENYRELLRALGLDPKAQPRIAAAPSAKNVKRRREVVFHPWASGDRAGLREWPMERWIQLAFRLRSADVTILLTGGPNDVARSAGLQEALIAFGVPTESLSGLNLKAVATRLQSVDLVVSVNTGLMHLAAIAGAPTVSLNGPTAAHRYGPVGPRVASVGPKHGGGFLHFGFEFRGNPTDTMLQIEVEDVVDGIRTVAPGLIDAEVTTDISFQETADTYAFATG